MKTKEFEHKIVALSDRVYPMVARLLGDNNLAEDAVQEIMIKLWDRRGKLKNHPNVPGFVFLTARNHCLDLLKKKKPMMDSSETQLKLLVSSSNHNELEWKELNTIIQNLLKELPAQQYEIMMLRDLDGLEYSEIATMMDLKIEHVRVLLSRARKQVGTKLKNIYSYE